MSISPSFGRFLVAEEMMFHMSFSLHSQRAWLSTLDLPSNSGKVVEVLATDLEKGSASKRRNMESGNQGV